MNTIQLPDKWTKYLISSPENGMGYQMVKVVLKDGKTLNNHKVVNSQYLVLDKYELIKKEDIALIELEKEE